MCSPEYRPLRHQRPTFGACRQTDNARRRAGRACDEKGGRRGRLAGSHPPPAICRRSADGTRLNNTSELVINIRYSITREKGIFLVYTTHCEPYIMKMGRSPITKREKRGPLKRGTVERTKKMGQKEIDVIERKVTYFRGLSCAAVFPTLPSRHCLLVLCSRLSRALLKLSKYAANVRVLPGCEPGSL